MIGPPAEPRGPREPRRGPPGGKKEPTRPERLALAAVGMEAELTLYVDGQAVRPEDVFGSPRDFIRGPLVHRTGSSYHLPNGGAVYFDTGVIEVATPVIELEPGCVARAGRSLWEGLHLVRAELDGWEERSGRSARLEGFSAHYNVSFDVIPGEGEPERGGERRGRTVEDLALLLAHVLPAPVMLLATNRRSTGVGFRPRGNRIEVTVDFTPSPSLMIAAGTVIAGVARAVMRWPTFRLSELERRGVPVLAGFQPVPHTSRKGWLASRESYPTNPFESDVDGDLWTTTAGDSTSLRDLAGDIAGIFRPSIRRISDPFTFRLIESVLGGRTPSLLSLSDRPPEYEDVGRLCYWDDLFPPAALSRSRYEQVLIRAISGQRLREGGRWLVPVGTRGWSQVVFRYEEGGEMRVLSIDELVRRLDDWSDPGEAGLGKSRRRRGKGGSGRKG